MTNFSWGLHARHCVLLDPVSRLHPGPAFCQRISGRRIFRGNYNAVRRRWHRATMKKRERTIRPFSKPRKEGWKLRSLRSDNFRRCEPSWSTETVPFVLETTKKLCNDVGLVNINNYCYEFRGYNGSSEPLNISSTNLHLLRRFRYRRLSTLRDFWIGKQPLDRYWEHLDSKYCVTVFVTDTCFPLIVEKT